MKKDILISIIAGIFLLGGAVISSPHWFKYLFPEQYLEQENLIPVKTKSNESISKTSKENLSNKSSGTENLIIDRIELSTRDFNIPSYFYFRITNNGTRTMENLEVTIDLGKAEYREFDFSKKIEIEIAIDSIDKSFVVMKIPKMKENETIDFYSLNTLPVFENILMNASNMTFDKIYTYQDYKDSEDDRFASNGAFNNFLWIMLSLVIIVFTIYFVIVLIAYLNKLFNIE